MSETEKDSYNNKRIPQSLERPGLSIGEVASMGSMINDLGRNLSLRKFYLRKRLMSSLKRETGLEMDHFVYPVSKTEQD